MTPDKTQQQNVMRKANGQGQTTLTGQLREGCWSWARREPGGKLVAAARPELQEGEAALKA